MSEVLIVPKESPYYWVDCCCDWNNSSDSEDDPETECNSDSEDDPEAESKKILQEIETISIKLKESEFYTELNKQINSVEFQSQFTCVRSSNDLKKVPMVIYGLGSLLKSTESRHQLAFALLLQKEMSDWISDGIEVYDPKLSRADMMVLEQLGCTVLSVNEDCKRRVERPTLFFMPYVPSHLESNLLEANWSPSNINHVILLTNRMSEDLEYYQLGLEQGSGLERPLKVDLEEGDSFDDRISLTQRMEYVEAIQKCIQEIKFHGNFSDIYLNDLKDVTDNFWLLDQFFKLPDMERMQYQEAIAKYTEEIEIPSLGDPYDNILYDFCFHFFNVAPEIDMQTLLQGEEELQLKFTRQFDKLPKLEQGEIVDLFEASIIEELRNQMAEVESAL
ncbi:hypothetical protein PTKIN_Ptkin03bG0050900 [Pterospermum kingtungense]